MSKASMPKTEIPSVDWWITSRCNLRCDFCYGPVRATDPLALRDRIADAIEASPTKAVTFCGGEPLLVKNISDYAIRQHHAGKVTILNTNGELLRRRFNSRRQIPFDVVGISIDGSTEDIHRRMRGNTANYIETLAAARWLGGSYEKPKLKIATVISSINVGQIDDLARLVQAVRPDIWRIYQYSSWGPQNRGKYRHRITDEQFQSAVDVATDIAAPVLVSASNSQIIAGCLIIDPYGKILHSRDKDYEALGNCLEEDIVNIWLQSPHRKVIQRNKRWLDLI